MELHNNIEALLFYKGEPVKKTELASYFKTTQEDVAAALVTLSQTLSTRGIRLLETQDEVTLGTAPEMSSFLEDLRRQELSKELSKASLETLSVILYKNGATRGDIDYLRGVNGSFILRNLSARGLIEKVPHPEDSRKMLYKPTFDLLRFLGVTDISSLPEYAAFHKTLTEEEGNAAKAEEEMFEKSE